MNRGVAIAAESKKRHHQKNYSKASFHSRRLVYLRLSITGLLPDYELHLTPTLYVADDEINQVTWVTWSLEA